MNVFLDANIIIDWLFLDNTSSETANKIIYISLDKFERVYISPLTLGIINYYADKLKNQNKKNTIWKTIPTIFNISSVDSEICNNALLSIMDDKEDAIQFFSALDANCKYLVTFDDFDFYIKDNKIQVLNGFTFLELFH